MYKVSVVNSLCYNTNVYDYTKPTSIASNLIHKVRWHLVHTYSKPQGRCGGDYHKGNFVALQRQPGGIPCMTEEGVFYEMSQNFRQISALGVKTLYTFKS